MVSDIWIQTEMAVQVIQSIDDTVNCYPYAKFSTGSLPGNKLTLSWDVWLGELSEPETTTFL